MKKSLFLFAIIFLGLIPGRAQNTIEWSADYKLSASDFLSKAPNSGAMQTALGSFSVSYEFGGISLITTRNLNSYVTCSFQKDASYLDKGDDIATKRLLKYQQLIFNLYELQARKLRQKFFIERKRLLLKGPATLHQEASAEHSQLLAGIEADTFHGASSEEIERWNKWVLQEIETLSEFCKTCKPKKQKKKNK